MLDFVTDTDMDKNVFGLLLSPQQNGEDSNEQVSYVVNWFHFMFILSDV